VYVLRRHPLIFRAQLIARSAYVQTENITDMNYRRDVCIVNMRGVHDVRLCATIDGFGGQVFDAPVQCTLDDPVVSSFGAV
jgi:hypothetical protein